MAHWLCKTRKYDEALQQGTDLYITDKIELISLIAKCAVDAKDKKGADQILDHALSILAAHGDDEAFFGDSEFFAELALENVSTELAGKFVSRLEQGSLRKSRILLKLARARASVGDKDAAIALIEDALRQTSGFGEDEANEVVAVTVSAATILASVAALDRATDLAGKANSILLSQAEPRSQDQVAVACLFADLGSLSQAVGMIESMQSQSRTTAFASLALHCKDKALARSLMERSRSQILAPTYDLYGQSRNLSSLVSAYIRADQIDDTFELLQKIREPFYLNSAAVEVANSLSAKGKTDEAVLALDLAATAAQKIVSEKSQDIPGYASGSNAQSKSHLLSELVEGFVRLGALSRAESAAMGIDHPQYRASAMSRVAVAYAAKDNHKKARSILMSAFSLSSDAGAYNHDQSREDALFNIVRAMGESGLRAEATVAINRFLDEVKSNDSLDQYVGHLFMIGDIAESQKIPINKRSQVLLKHFEEQQSTN